MRSRLWPSSSATFPRISIKAEIVAKALVIGLLRLSALLPLPVTHGLASVIGWLASVFPNPPRRIAAINLELCFPDWDSKVRRQLLRRNLVETSKAMLELGPLWLWEGERILSLIQSVEGEQTVREALSGGRGGIAITPHLGAWEVSGLYVSSRYPLTLLYRPSRLGIDDLISTGRQRLGAHAVPTSPQGVRALLQTLRAGQVVGILPDQDPGKEGGIFAPFFHRPANTMVLLSRLAMKSGVPVFLVYAERLPWGRGYRLHFRVLPPVVNDGPLEASVAAVNQAVEEAVRAIPSQYLWSYKRFKRRPPGEPKLY